MSYGTIYGEDGTIKYQHQEGICDKCEEYPAKHRCPFIYKDMNDESHGDLGDGYRQYYLCDDCYAKELKTWAHQRRNKQRAKDIEISEEIETIKI